MKSEDSEQLKKRIRELENENAQLEESTRKLRNENAQLKEAKEKFRAFYENAPLPFQSLAQNGCFLDINQSWLKTLGYDREEVIGEYFADFLHEDWKPHFEKYFPDKSLTSSEEAR